jgi:hypothetical protein
MEKFSKYLAAFDGSNDWSAIEPLFDDVFHDDAVVVTADGERSKAQWKDMAKGLCAKGAKASDFEVTKEEGDAIFYKLVITLSDDNAMHMTAKGTVKDGQLIRVEPVDPAAYAALESHGTS